MEYPHRRVVITGLGLVSPLGNSAEALWEGLLSGKSPVAPLESFRVDHLPTRFAAEARTFTGTIDDFGPLQGEKKKAIRKGLKLMCRETQLGVAAGQRALEDAGWGSGGYDVERTGVTFGSDYMMTWPEEFQAGIVKCTEAGEFQFADWGQIGMKEVTPLWLLKYLPNMPASHLAIYNDLRGPSNSQTMREASSHLAIGEAFRTVSRGDAETMLAGATGTRIQPMKLVHALMQEQVAADGIEPTQASRPFDLHRSGQVLGEGSGAVVLEELEFAKARGAKIYGEMVGFGASSVADRDGVADRKRALVNAMRAALNDARMSPAELGHIHAHGLSTTTCDAAEAAAIVEVFGNDAARIPVVAAKSYFGNLGAGSGAVELIGSVLALNVGQLFPTLNYETPDPDCPVRVSDSQEVPAGNSLLNLSITPQGQAAAVVVRLDD
jgi:3-oxoacyl-[acyl-carrier-protein] synthase II